MKKTTILLCLCALALFPQAGAQTLELMQGRIAVRNLDAGRTEGNLFVTMEVDASKLDLKTDRETVLTPVLRNGDKEARFPALLIAGRNRYYYHLRNDEPSDEVGLYRAGRTGVIGYRAALPYEPWMGSADLSVEESMRGCCSEQLSQNENLLANLDLEPKPQPEPKVFAPSFVYVRPAAEAVKSREVSGSAFIDFPVNRTEIYEDYRNNPSELMKIRQTIEAVRNDPDTRITAVSIKGYASPEGPYANNERLAQGRTATLKNYVQGLYDFPDAALSTAWEAEDWDGLEKKVSESNLPHRDALLAIIRGNLAPDAKDWKLKSTYPEDYAYLLREIYPGLRHSDYTVRYTVRAYTDVEEIRRLLHTQPQKLSLEELYLAAQDMEPGSDEYNEVFEIAVRMFPADATANLNAANTALQRRDMKNAERYLAKAGDTPETVYAKGLYAALNEDYATAERLLAEAEAAGIAQAADALAQIREMTAETEETR